MKKWKQFDELFSGYFIKPKLVDKDSNGYGTAASWEVSNPEKKVVFTGKTLTEARKYILQINKDGEQRA